MRSEIMFDDLLGKEPTSSNRLFVSSHFHSELFGDALPVTQQSLLGCHHARLHNQHEFLNSATTADVSEPVPIVVLEAGV